MEIFAQVKGAYGLREYRGYGCTDPAVKPFCKNTCWLSPRFPMTSEALRANPPVLMNEREVALFVGIWPRSVKNFTSRKLLPVICLGRRRLYRRDAVLAALQTLEGYKATNPRSGQKNAPQLNTRVSIYALSGRDGGQVRKLSKVPVKRNDTLARVFCLRGKKTVRSINIGVPI